MKTLRFIHTQPEYWLFFYLSIAATVITPIIFFSEGCSHWSMLVEPLVFALGIVIWNRAKEHREKLITDIKVDAGYELANDDTGTLRANSGAYQRTIAWIDREADPMKSYEFKADTEGGVDVFVKGATYREIHIPPFKP